LASSIEIPGSVIGIYMSDPSFNGGINSEPRRDIGHKVVSKIKPAPKITGHLKASAILTNGS